MLVAPKVLVSMMSAPGLQKPAMDVADHLRLRQREEVAVVQQVLLRVLEALPADVGFRHPVGADGRAHRSIDDGDAVLEDLLKRMLLGCSHVSQVVPNGAKPIIAGWRPLPRLIAGGGLVKHPDARTGAVSNRQRRLTASQTALPSYLPHPSSHTLHNSDSRAALWDSALRSR